MYFKEQFFNYLSEHARCFYLFLYQDQRHTWPNEVVKMSAKIREAIMLYYVMQQDLFGYFGCERTIR